MAAKKLKKGVVALIVVACIVVSIGIVALGLGLYAARADEPTQPADVLSYWMDYVEDATLLKKVAIPGSHDSGTTGMLYVSETQGRSIIDQLRCGVRYLDIRVALKKGDYIVYHGPIYGMSYETVLKDVKAFLTAHPTETIILDLQHFKDGAQPGAIALTEQYLGSFYLKNETELTDLEYIDALTVGQARGKVLVVVGEDDGTYSSQNCYFLRNNDDGTVQNAVLKSDYNEKYNKGSAKQYVEEYVGAYLDAFKSFDKGLFVLQCQLTDGLMFLGPKFRESQNLDGMNAYVKSLATSPDLSYINIVLRDYVNPAKTAPIVLLNAAKNNLKAATASEFSALLS